MNNIRFVVLLVTLGCVSVHGASGDREPGVFPVRTGHAEMTAVPTVIAEFVRSEESERNRFLVKLLDDLCEACKSTRFGGLVECLERRQLLNIIKTLSDSVQIQLTESARLRAQITGLELTNTQLDRRVQALQELNRRLSRPEVFEEEDAGISSDLVSPVQTIGTAPGDEPADDSHE